MKSFKSFVLSCVAIIAVFALNICSYAEWVQDGSNWKYQEGGAFVTNNWKELDNSIYYFDANGYMSKGLVKIGSSYHVFDNNGRPYKKGKEFEYAGETYEVGAKGKLADMTEEVYQEYVKEQANNAAFKADQEAKAKAMQESIAASKAAYQIEHAAEIAASEAAKQAENAAKAQAAAAKSAEAAAKYELLISSANREKLQSETNKATSRKMAIRNLAAETRRQLNERRSQMISQAKTEFATNQNAEIDKISDLFTEVVNEYASVLDGMLDVLSSKYKMRDESYDDAVGELSEVLDTARTRFADDFAKIGEVKD